jgi:phosphoribosylaminoimidazole-succinocarboxamide synthase
LNDQKRGIIPGKGVINNRISEFLMLTHAGTFINVYHCA